MSEWVQCLLCRLMWSSKMFSNCPRCVGEKGTKDGQRKQKPRNKKGDKQ